MNKKIITNNLKIITFRLFRAVGIGIAIGLLFTLVFRLVLAYKEQVDKITQTVSLIILSLVGLGFIGYSLYEIYTGLKNFFTKKL